MSSTTDMSSMLAAMAAGGKNNDSNNNMDMASQMAVMQKMMADQQKKMAEMEEERKEKEEELERAKMEMSRLESGRQSRLTEDSAMAASIGSDISEVDVLKRKLQEQEESLRARENQLREKEDRISLIERSSNSVMSNGDDMSSLFEQGYQNNGEIPPVRICSCDCTNRGFSRCVMYRKDICSCSVSCQFVKDYLKPPKGQSFFMT